MGENPSALVLEIQKMSTEDGPGLRTTLFLKGCSLSCRWCHNPEGISPLPQVRWTESRCVGCRECLSLCPRSALAEQDGIRIDRGACDGCGRCAEHCPSGALELWGRRLSCAEAFRELAKDRAYFAGEGGVTVSGGEAALQSGFVEALFGLLQAEGIHTALDTCGLCSPGQLAQSCRNADLILFDIKEIDGRRHREYTGGPLEAVLESYGRVMGMRKRVWIRTPIIPGMTDRIENVEGIARFLLQQGPFELWELCAFNNLCRDKYRRLGLRWELERAPLMSAPRMEELRQAAVRSGVDAGKVRWNGMTASASQ